MLSAPRMPLPVGSLVLHSLSFGNALESAICAARSSVFISSFVLAFPSVGKASQMKRIIDLLAFKIRSHGLDARIALSYFAGRSVMGARSVNAFYYLASMGIPFRFPLLERSLHAKFVIIDEAVYFIGSHNLYDFSLENPLELTLEVRDAAFCSAARNDFLKWWPCLVQAPFVDGVSWQK